MSFGDASPLPPARAHAPRKPSPGTGPESCRFDGEAHVPPAPFPGVRRLRPSPSPWPELAWDPDVGGTGNPETLPALSGSRFFVRHDYMDSRFWTVDSRVPRWDTCV